MASRDARWLLPLTIALAACMQPTPPTAPQLVESGASELHTTLEQIRARFDVPALAAARIEGDRIVAIAAVGVRRSGSEERVATDDCWHLGSCGKALTATLLALLIEEGRLRWDSTLAEPPAFEPGSKRVYANTNYLLLGAIAERVADRPFEELLRTKLFTPLGMTSAGFGPPGRDGATAPWGHGRLLGFRIAHAPDDDTHAHPAYYAPACSRLSEASSCSARARSASRRCCARCSLTSRSTSRSTSHHRRRFASSQRGPSDSTSNLPRCRQVRERC